MKRGKGRAALGAKPGQLTSDAKSGAEKKTSNKKGTLPVIGFCAEKKFLDAS